MRKHHRVVGLLDAARGVEGVLLFELGAFIRGGGDGATLARLLGVASGLLGSRTGHRFGTGQSMRCDSTTTIGQSGGRIDEGRRDRGGAHRDAGGCAEDDAAGVKHGGG